LLKAAKSGKQADIKLLTEQLCRALDRDGMLRQSNFPASYQRGFKLASILQLEANSAKKPFLHWLELAVPY
jgi:hypothetical protein